MRTLLSVKQGEAVKRYLLNKEQVRVGRGQGCEIRINHPQISRIHAVFQLRGQGEYWIVDGDLQGQGSRNGTYVNGTLTRSARLKDGDMISFGPNVKASFQQVRVGVSQGPRDTVPVEQQVPSIPYMTGDVPTQISRKSSASNQ